MIQNQTITKINEIITNLPESRLEELLSYLKRIEKTSKEKRLKDSLVKKILEEDKELLKDLAK